MPGRIRYSGFHLREGGVKLNQVIKNLVLALLLEMLHRGDGEWKGERRRFMPPQPTRGLR